MMEDFRSKSCGDGRMQIGNYYGPTTTTAGPNLNGNGMQDLQFRHLHKLNNPKTMMPSSRKESQQMGLLQELNFNDPELQRKKRFASYKVYTVEGKVTVKGSFKKSFRWIKDWYSVF